MDLALYKRVLWRHRVLVTVGIGIGIFLAGASYYKLTVDGITPKLVPRKAETWQGTTTIFLSSAQTRQSYTNPARYTGFAPLYAQFANSDPVKKLALARCGASARRFSAIPGADTSYGAVNPLPFVNIFGTGPTPGTARQASECATGAFLAYMTDQQVQSQIPKRQRVRMTVIKSAAANAPLLVVPRKKTLPIVVFMAILFATVGLAFILENTRAAARVAPAEADGTPLKPADAEAALLKPADAEAALLKPADAEAALLKPAEVEDAPLKGARRLA